MPIVRSRREFVAGLSLAAATGLLDAGTSLADEGPPETTTIRIARWPVICLAPAYIAEPLLRAEGFTNIRYVESRYVESSLSDVARGEIDFDLEAAAVLATYVDAGQPVTAIAGVHSGCYELFAHEPVRTISDLKGRRVGIEDFGSAGHLYLSVMAAHVGLDPHKDIDWVVRPDGGFIELFTERKVDAVLAFPPEPQELRARKVGHVIMNMTTDKPWSQYFCCMAYGNRAFVREHPVATKRFLRAILKAADLCSTAPEATAQRLVDGGFTLRYDYALQTLAEIPYTRWRDSDPEDSMRFYALQLHEVGMIKSDPKALIADGTDWRFLNELKRELKV
jgi:NitT/TauT family transport system substrate-binding protein